MWCISNKHMNENKVFFIVFSTLSLWRHFLELFPKTEMARAPRIRHIFFAFVASIDTSKKMNVMSLTNKSVLLSMLFL